MSPLDETDIAFTLMVFLLEAGYYKLFNGDLERGKRFTFQSHIIGPTVRWVLEEKCVV